MKHLISGGKGNYNIKKRDLYILEYLRNELNSTKSKIDQYYTEWESIKKIIHDYEYVYYSSYRKKNISSVAPVSRSYFKFREIFYDFNMNIKYINTVCNLAEAPGGFIESLIHLSNGKKINIYANSLLSNDKRIPMWNNKIKRFKINTLYGIKNNGDICDFTNIISMIYRVGRNSCELVTGDGGFDYSSDYSNQEKNSLKLIRCEIFLALNIQKIGGNFICKIFDTFHIETIKLLYILNLAYEKVYLYKPRTSRNSNSEKYIVCLNYKKYDIKMINIMCHSIKNDKLNIHINKYFYNNLLRFICDYSIQQIKSINNGINMITNNKIDNKPTEKQIVLGKRWCKDYDIRINDRCIYL
jgi:23S rRNA U2552 (ribose-2'-O)-methylase RlmE/FtsJ